MCIILRLCVIAVWSAWKSRWSAWMHKMLKAVLYKTMTLYNNSLLGWLCDSCAAHSRQRLVSISEQTSRVPEQVFSSTRPAADVLTFLWSSGFIVLLFSGHALMCSRKPNQSRQWRSVLDVQLFLTSTTVLRNPSRRRVSSRVPVINDII